jgi:hypothetical protein
MKRSGLILVVGVVVALAAYSGLYFAGTARVRNLERNDTPELAWLKAEFHLDDAEYGRICQMHESYLTGCAERCRRIDEKNARLRELLSATNAITPEIEQTLREAAQLRAECQKQMLEEFYAVSRTMPPEQGKRYLAWVQGRTILAGSHSQMHPETVTHNH